MGGTEDSTEEENDPHADSTHVDSEHTKDVETRIEESKGSGKVNVTINFLKPRTTPSEKIQLFFTAALFVVGVIAACIYYGQLKVMRGQLDEMTTQQRDTEALLRARLVYTDPRMTPYDVHNRPVSKSSPNIVRWGVSPGWKDLANTGAQDVNSAYVLKFLPNKGRFNVREIQQECPPILKNAPIPGAPPIFRGEPVIVPGKSLPIGVAEAANISRKVIIFSFQANYRDIFNKKHLSYVCVWINVLDARNSQFSFVRLKNVST